MCISSKTSPFIAPHCIILRLCYKNKFAWPHSFFFLLNFVPQLDVDAELADCLKFLRITEGTLFFSPSNPKAFIVRLGSSSYRDKVQPNCFSVRHNHSCCSAGLFVSTFPRRWLVSFGWLANRMEPSHGKSETEDSLDPCAEVTLSCKVVCQVLFYAPFILC